MKSKFTVIRSGGDRFARAATTIQTMTQEELYSPNAVSLTKSAYTVESSISPPNQGYRQLVSFGGRQDRRARQMMIADLKAEGTGKEYYVALKLVKER